MPGYRVLRTVTLLCVVVVFAASTLVSYRRHVETSQLLTVTQKGGGWASSELEFELLRFMHILESVGLGRGAPDELVLRFDLLWSRIDVLREGAETSEVREMAGAQLLLDELQAMLRRIEPRVLSLTQGDTATADQLVDSLIPFEKRVRAFNVASFNGPDAQNRIRRVFELNRLVSISIVGLVLSGTLLILMLIRESSRSRHQSLHDELTGLPNRKFINQHLTAAAKAASRAGSLLGVHVIDLNNFKEINDTLGHNCGDQMLQQVAARLSGCIGPHDTVARLGGDEFLVIQERVKHADSCTRLSRLLCEQIGHEMLLDGTRIYPSASLGVSIYPVDADSVAQVQINADLAMYRAKRDSGVSYRRFEPEMNEVIQRANTLARELKEAIQDNQLVLHYQPVVEFESGRIVSIEALLRWHHPRYGYVSPVEVVTIAEQYGLALELNEWVIRQVCLQYRHWVAEGVETVCVAVNISPSMYALHDLEASLTQILEDTAMSAEHLIIEVTEDTTMRDIESSPDTLHKLKALGVQIALDDFGTGYSSLNHLKRLPVDKLKIDRSFIQDLNISPKDPRIIRSIIGLAESLDLQIIAEGIEFVQNVDDLVAEGCLLGQGFLFSKAVDSARITEMLRSQQQGIPLFQAAEIRAGMAIVQRA
ncbi:EAL domain-containing protein [Marinobacterium sp. D7]|uniref:putative bifunctional diguanylate cyclase/phosphodiesterase n=1 Tax=Marinobacterium ramblicola TaxID=2849041 RepID=UPI001C2D9FFA|nr:EAL domain-containing protein [Marinobacterium ramblicola]MBV1790035.1 EAL domain-containing protein [Marinobacterium ramblicola]